MGKESKRKEAYGKLSERFQMGQKMLEIISKGDEARVRKRFQETKSVSSAAEAAKNLELPLTFHDILQICAEEKLREEGYDIISKYEAPEDIQKVGLPDIIAVKDGEYVLAEVKVGDAGKQLSDYSKAKARLIFVLPLEKGDDMEVWGLQEIES